MFQLVGNGVTCRNNLVTVPIETDALIEFDYNHSVQQSIVILLEQGKVCRANIHGRIHVPLVVVLKIL